MKMIKTIKKYQDESSQLFVNKAEYVRKGILEDDLLRKEYLFCRANKHNFMPESSIDDTIFFENIQAHKRLRIVEDKTEHNVLMDLISAEGNMNFLKDSSEKPHIFCSFHFGSFMQIGPYLNKLGIDFSVLTEPGINHRHLHPTVEAEQLEVMHSNSSGILLNMIETLRSNKSLIVFLDGGKGSNLDTERKSYATVDFLGKKYFVKKGIPALSYIANVPIIPVISYRTDKGEMKLFFGNPIEPTRTISREVFVNQTIQACFDLFTKYLLDNPEQFTLWHALHQYIDIQTNTSNVNELPKVGKCCFNQNRYIFYHDEKARYLFDKVTLSCYAISDGVWNLLQKFPPDGVNVEWLYKSPNISLWQDFARKEILVAA